MIKFITFLKLLFLITALFTLVGCAGPRTLYNYGDYSDRYYENKKNMNQETTLKLQLSIEKAIENADYSISGRVAPGMYANLGYIYLKNGNSGGAIINFKKEMSIYPESAHFMNRMIKKIQLAESEKK